MYVFHIIISCCHESFNMLDKYSSEYDFNLFSNLVTIEVAYHRHHH